MKKILVYLGLFILMSSLAFGLTPCTTEESTTSATFTDVDVVIDENIVMGGEQIFDSIVNLTPTNTFNFTRGHYENLTITNSTNSSLYWPVIDATSVVIYNATNSMLLGAENYTVFATDGIIWWNLSDDSTFSNWTGVKVSVYYNKSFLALETDLVELALGYNENSPSYGGTKTWGLSRSELNNTNWTMYYTYSDRTCAARDSCLATRTTIFAGFALIAVAIVVLSAFAIIKLISGEMTGAALGVLAVAIIGLAIIIMIGYYITSVVGVSVCGAAVA